MGVSTELWRGEPRSRSAAGLGGKGGCWAGAQPSTARFGHSQVRAEQPQLSTGCHTAGTLLLAAAQPGGRCSHSARVCSGSHSPAGITLRRNRPDPTPQHPPPPPHTDQGLEMLRHLHLLEKRSEGVLRRLCQLRKGTWSRATTSLQCE